MSIFHVENRFFLPIKDTGGLKHHKFSIFDGKQHPKKNLVPWMLKSPLTSVLNTFTYAHLPDLCTFLSNDTILSRRKEDWFHCHTCGFEENEGICSVCVRTCHLNHEVTYADYSKFLCDCGSQGEEQCRALTRGRNLKDDHPDQNGMFFRGSN